MSLTSEVTAANGAATGLYEVLIWRGYNVVMRSWFNGVITGLSRVWRGLISCLEVSSCRPIVSWSRCNNRFVPLSAELSSVLPFCLLSFHPTVFSNVQWFFRIPWLRGWHLALRRSPAERRRPARRCRADASCPPSLGTNRVRGPGYERGFLVLSRMRSVPSEERDDRAQSPAGPSDVQARASHSGRAPRACGCYGQSPY